MEWKSVGMMTFPIYGKIKFMFQTTNQIGFLSFGLTILGNSCEWTQLPFLEPSFSNLYWTHSMENVDARARSGPFWESAWVHCNIKTYGYIWKFPKSWGYPQIIQVMDDHDLVLKPRVTWGSIISRNRHIPGPNSISTISNNPKKIGGSNDERIQSLRQCSMANSQHPYSHLQMGT